MPLEFYASASFNRSVRKLGAEQREMVVRCTPWFGQF